MPRMLKLIYRTKKNRKKRRRLPTNWSKIGRTKEIEKR